MSTMKKENIPILGKQSLFLYCFIAILNTSISFCLYKTRLSESYFVYAWILLMILVVLGLVKMWPIYCDENYRRAALRNPLISLKVGRSFAWPIGHYTRYSKFIKTILVVSYFLLAAFFLQFLRDVALKIGLW